MTEIELWTKPGCPFCARAKALLDGKGARYREIVASQDPQIRAEMVKKAQGRNTFPQIFIGGKGIGGCDDLYALDKAGKLDAMLKP